MNRCRSYGYYVRYWWVCREFADSWWKYYCPCQCLSYGRMGLSSTETLPISLTTYTFELEIAFYFIKLINDEHYEILQPQGKQSGEIHFHIKPRTKDPWITAHALWAFKHFDRIGITMFNELSPNCHIMVSHFRLCLPKPLCYFIRKQWMEIWQSNNKKICVLFVHIPYKC